MSKVDDAAGNRSRGWENGAGRFCFEAKRWSRAGFCARVGGFFLSVSNVRVTSDVHIFFGKAVGDDVVIMHRRRHRNSVALLNRGRLAISTDPLFLFRTRADRK